jgi:hypothetical protein
MIWAVVEELTGFHVFGRIQRQSAQMWHQTFLVHIWMETGNPKVQYLWNNLHKP